MLITTLELFLLKILSCKPFQIICLKYSDFKSFNFEDEIPIRKGECNTSIKLTLVFSYNFSLQRMVNEFLKLVLNKNPDPSW
jgi:hypothetical protein